MRRFNVLAVCLGLLAAVGTAVATADPPTQKSNPNFVQPKLVGRASDAGGFALSEAKLKELFPDYQWNERELAYIKDHLERGDSRAAIVASVKPLVVSAYSDELDAVILIAFPERLVEKYSLHDGDQLIVSWTYPRAQGVPGDIVQGERNLGRYNNGQPLIADFISDSADALKARKSVVTDKEWERVKALTPPAMKRADGKYRSAFPLYSHVPPELLTKDIPTAQ